MDEPIIWLIDENKRELQTHQQIFELIMSGEGVQVKGLLVRPDMNDYLPIMQDPNTACIIIDQKLKETGIANYTGIELAQFLRPIDNELPIYILTKYAGDWDEFSVGAWSVEEILDKTEISEGDENWPKIKARVLRRIKVYKEILNEREQRFSELLKKSWEDNLDENDRRELEELQLKRSSAILADELAQIEELEQVVEAHKKLMATLKESSNPVKNDNS